MTRRTGRPNGRPTKIDHVLVRRDDGTVETIADRIIAHIRAGNYLETAAAAAGIDRTTLHDWLKVGAGTQAKIAKGAERRYLTARELACAEFSLAVLEADAQATATDVALSARMARGLPREVVTEKLAPKLDPTSGRPLLDHLGEPVMEVIERTVRTEAPEPDGAMVRWRLERRHPELFGKTSKVELSGLGGGPIEVELTVEQKRARLVDTLDRVAERLREDPEAALDAYVIDSTAKELASGPESDGS